MMDRGPESEWRDLECPDCKATYFDIEISRAQSLHDTSENCTALLSDLTD